MTSIISKTVAVAAIYMANYHVDHGWAMNGVSMVMVLWVEGGQSTGALA